MLVLFFDTYIVKGVGSKSGIYVSNYVEKILSEVRDNFPAYAWQEKVDVVKYTLASYSKIKWDRVIIRFECEDSASTDMFYNYCLSLFPNANIVNERSDTAKKYAQALSDLNLPDDAWIFFSPNNDHPFLAKPEHLEFYIDYADRQRKKYPEDVIGIIYSHHFESTLDNKPSQPLWGYFNNRFKKLLAEDEMAYVVKANVLSLDSIQILPYRYLVEMFSTTKNKGRVIRLEDLEFNWSKNENFIQICPKVELCRHYDGYTSYMDFVAPLFIPPGFFSNEIKVMYGFDYRKLGFLNINPNFPIYSKYTDLSEEIEKVPFFWKDKIFSITRNEEFELNPLYHEKYGRNSLLNRSKGYNLLRSFYLYFIKQNINKITKIVRFILRKTPIYPELQKIKRTFSSEKNN